MRKNTSTGEYLAFLTIKYEVDPDSFFSALVAAEEEGKSKTGSLSIECRGKTSHKIMFLILKDTKVVAQFSIIKEFLREQGNPIKNLMKTELIRRYVSKNRKRSLVLPIKQLQTGMSQISLKARVLKIPKPTLVFTRYGNYASVTNALIADETGMTKLCLWNEQISSISPGDTIQIQNARASSFKGEMQLRIGRKGTLASIEDPCRKIEEVYGP